MDIFDLGIRHLLLERGEIYYNNRKGEISADLHDLMLQSGFEPLTKSYSGTLSYRDGHLQLQNSNSIGHNFSARFLAAPEEFKLEGAELNAGSSRLSVVANVRDYSQPQVHVTYEATIDTNEFRRALKNGSLPTGILQSSGVLEYDNRLKGPFLATVAARGEVRSAGMTLTSESAQLELRNIGARYSLANGNAEIEGIHAQLLGGALAGTLTIRDLAGSTKSRLSASLRAVSLARVQSDLQRTKSAESVVDQIALRGLLNATADATWGKTMQDLLARVDATLQGSAQPAKGGARTPLNGVIHTRYIGKSAQLAVEQSYIRTPGTSIALNGTISDNAALRIRANSEDLHELETVAAGFQVSSARPLGVYGRAALNATVSGSTRSPQISGQLTAEDLRVRGSEWKLLRASVAASPSQIRVENGEIVSASRGRVTFKLVTALQQWSPTEATPFQVQIAASQISAADLVKVAGSTTPVAGTLSADIVASGTQLAPAGHGKLSLTSARFAGEPIRVVDLQFQGTGKEVNANLQIDLPAGSATTTVLYEPASQSYRAELHTSGIKLDQLETVKQRNLQLQGVLEGTASGRGTLQDPEMQVLIEVPQLRVRDQVIRGLKLQSNIVNHAANFTLDSEVLNTHAGGHGTVQLTGDYLADASFDTQTIPIASISRAIYAPSQAGNVTGQTEVHATLRGPLKGQDSAGSTSRDPAAGGELSEQHSAGG